MRSAASGATEIHGGRKLKLYVCNMDILKSIFIWIEGILFIIIFFPITCLAWILVLPFDRERKVMHWMLIYQAYLVSMILPIWKINIEGREKADRKSTYVIISNHQSILDILIINCLRYQIQMDLQNRGYEKAGTWMVSKNGRLHHR